MVTAKEQKLDGKIVPERARLSAQFVRVKRRRSRRPARSRIIMVKAGKPVDDMIEQLLPHLEKGDAIIECGNSLYTDTARRFDYLTPKGIGYLGVGVSGGEEGARHGPSIMVGGSEEQWHNAEPVLTAIAAKYKGEACCAYLGKGGAGHFVKTIHNGIEYGDMQMIAEVYGVMRDGLGMNPVACSEVFKQWNKGPLNSYLIEITGHVLAAVDQKTGKPLVRIESSTEGRTEGHRPLVGNRRAGAGRAGNGDRGRGRSTLDLGAQGCVKRVAAEGLYGKRNAGKSNLTLEDLEKALLAGKLVSYAQGFAVMAKAPRRKNGWNLPMPTIAKNLRRAGLYYSLEGFLDQITAAFNKGPVSNLLVAPT